MQVTIKQLLEAGVHFGHQTQRWNPKMSTYIFDSRNDIHIIDLQKAIQGLRAAYNFIREKTAEGATVLFIGTKKQAQNVVFEEATRSNSLYINQRWLGGTLTNFKNIRNNVLHMEEIERQERDGILNLLTKKEASKLVKEKERLQNLLNGIRNMDSLPGILFVIDTNKEKIAVAEARKLGIPVVAIGDTNSNPDEINYCIPGNDDAIRAIRLITSTIANAILEGRQQAQQRAMIKKKEVEETEMSEEELKEESPILPSIEGYEESVKTNEGDLKPEILLEDVENTVEQLEELVVEKTILSNIAISEEVGIQPSIKRRRRKI